MMQKLILIALFILCNNEVRLCRSNQNIYKFDSYVHSFFSLECFMQETTKLSQTNYIDNK